jgi:Rrf2 family protein
VVFSQTVEYALRAAVYLATKVDEPQVTGDIADKTRVPAGYLSKVLQSLGRGGLVHAQRGVGGGWVLARPPEQITILDVINTVDPIKRITTCPLGLSAHGTRLCPLHRKLDDALAQIEEAFGTSTLADILNTPTSSRPLCNVTVQGIVAAKH